jgi:beta-glucosidase
MANRTYRYFSGKPLYAFGHGLSYTTFKYSKGKLDSARISANGTIKLSFTLKNSGKRDGDDVAQIYYRHVNSKVPQPKQSLCGFKRLSLEKGKSRKVTIEIPAGRLRYWDVEKKRYIVEPGKYELLIGGASDDIRLRLPLTVVSKN